ncbi:MAG: hypothetical protein RLZZ597_2521 [Cyanobacteriota bacterium]|jgi:hypothetical protein
MIIYHPSASLPYTPIKVAFITGLSNPSSCSLSREYKQFLSQLDCPEAWKIYLNFPYIPSQEEVEEEVEKVFILNASLANFQQFIGARSHHYRQAVQRHLINVLTSTDRLFLVVGSCGLEILNQAWTDVIPADRIKIVALGPVARHRPQASGLLVQGTRDSISRLFFQDVDVRLPDVGHMDYVRDHRVFELVSQSLTHLQAIS